MNILEGQLIQGHLLLENQREEVPLITHTSEEKQPQEILS